MIYLKRLFYIGLTIVIVLFLSYNLPTRDIVHIVGTDVKRMDIKEGAFGWDRPDSGTDHNDIRDVRFINAVKANGNPMVYRNEDTDWGWPPYFKFDSSDLNAQAQEYAKHPDDWVIVYNYGWRIKIFSIFPNAYKLKPATGPNMLLIPWFNMIVILVMIFLLFWFRRWFRALWGGKSKKTDKQAAQSDTGKTS